MIIVDTNVWVSFFKGEKKAFSVKDMIIENLVILHPYIYGELLLGGIAQKAEKLLASLQHVTVAEENLVYQFITRNKLNSRGIGWVDVNILVSAILEKHKVYTFDENLSEVCREFNCHFTLSSV